MATTINSDGVSTSGVIITVSDPPATPTDTGKKGSIAWDENFIYVCIADNLWARTNISYAW
jgi:hypothetical protein